MKKCLLFSLILFSTFACATGLQISDGEMSKINSERKVNGFTPLEKSELTDEAIQNDLDKRLEDNLSLLRAKKPQLPSMPLMEKLGKQNKDREEKRKSAYRNALEAIKENN